MVLIADEPAGERVCEEQSGKAPGSIPGRGHLRERDQGAGTCVINL